MTPTEVVLAAALGASFLTGLASLGAIWFQEWRQGKAGDEDALQASIQELLSRSMAVALRARTMGEMMILRSGLKEGWDVTMRHRKLVDHLELHDWLAQDVVPLNAALGEIWTRDDQEGIRLANDVVNACMDLLGASIARQQGGNGWERMRRWTAGEKWTSEMIEENNRAMRRLAYARRLFADHARARFGLGAVELFTLAESDDKPVPVPQSPDSSNGPAAIEG
jgi:hypothetical protein